MPKKLDAVADVVKPAVAEETFDHYRVTNLTFQNIRPDGAGVINVTITPCREDGGQCFYNTQKSVSFQILDPLTEAAANPAGLVQAWIDASIDLVADKNSLVNAATV